MIAKTKKNYKLILYIIIGIIVLYNVVRLSTCKSNMPANLQSTIDSLTKVNKELIQKQKHLDSVISIFETEVKHIDNKINHVKDQTTIINEYYNNVSQEAEHYDATQIDSFFKARYKY